MFDFAGEDKKIILTAGIVALLFGYPFYFLVQRENIDGWVFLFLSLGLYWLYKPKKELFSSFFFSLAIVFKIYPALIILPILLNKKWRLLFWIGLWLALWGAITLLWFSDFRTALSMRSQSFFRFDENGSLIATIDLFTILIASLGIPVPATTIIKYSPTAAFLIYVLLISSVFFADYKTSKTTNFEITSYLLYLPFMIVFPKVIYHYSLIICLLLIPALSHLWKTSETRPQKGLIFIITIGVALTQWQTVATYKLTDNIVSHIIPGFGLLMVLIGIAIYKIYELSLAQDKITAEVSAIPS